MWERCLNSFKTIDRLEIQMIQIWSEKNLVGRYYLVIDKALMDHYRDDQKDIGIILWFFRLKTNHHEV